MKYYNIIRNGDKIQDYIYLHQGEEPNDDNTVKMPVIGKKGKNGRYTYEGVDEEVNDLMKYREYYKYYDEIYGILIDCFEKGLDDVFQNAVNSLIYYFKWDNSTCSDETMFEINEPISAASTLRQKFNYSPADGGIEDGIRVFKAESNIKQLLNMINVANGKKKRYSPFAINSYINKKSKDSSKKQVKISNGRKFLFPVFTEKGMVTQVEDGNLELMFDLITEEEAEKIKNYMLSEVDGNDLDTKKYIERTFEAYARYARDFNADADSEEFLETVKFVVERSISLFDIDISGFKKGPVHVNVMTPLDDDRITPIEFIYDDNGKDPLNKNKKRHQKGNDDDGGREM